MKWLRSIFDSRYSILIIIAIALRLALIPNPGFEADISFWKSWGLATVDFGIVEGMKVTNNNYPTPFAYTLGAMVWIYKLFANPHNFNEFWSNTNLLFLTISKLLPILADFGIAGIFLYIGRHAKKFGFPIIHNSPASPSEAGRAFFIILAIGFLLNPIAIIDGAWWGQVDSVGVFIFLSAVLLALSKHPGIAGFVFMLSMMTKLQNMIYGPLFFLFLWQSGGLKGLIRGSVGAVLGFVGLNTEFILTRNMDRVFVSLTENYDYFPWMSLLAYNLWWIVTGARGLITSDKLTVLGLLNAKTVGLLIFSSFYLFAVLRQIAISIGLTGATGNKIFEDRFPKSETKPAMKADMRESAAMSDNLMSSESRKFLSPGAKVLPIMLRTFLESLILVNGAFFLFQTQSHDRYAFPLVVFLLLWAPFYVSGNGVRGMGIRIKLFTVYYVLFTVFYFYNLHTALAINYPQNGIPFLSSLTQPVFTITTAYVLLGLFGVFLFSLIRSSSKTRSIAVVVFVVFIVLVSALNKPLWTKQPVDLTAFTPFISEQAYGTRQTNKSVQSSFGGPYKWTRLSVQYLFYNKGIGTHANSKHVYDINGAFKMFTVDFGIDTEAGQKASAVFEIYGDGKQLFASKKMGRFDLPKHAEVNVTGVKQLMLITTDAGDGNTDDHTDWLNPVLWP